MKLYVVHLPGVHTFVEVRETSKKVDPYGVVTMVNEGRSFEFQNKIGAEEVSRVFGGQVDVIEYNIKEIMK